MRVLALDTAVEACSLALGEATDTGLAVRAALSEPMTRGHGDRLFALFAAALDEAGWARPARLDRVVVTIGPGTFTGARVGLAAARALALAWNAPCLGVSTLEALAASVTARTAPRIAVIDARRDQLYAQAFDAAGAPLSDPLAAAPEAVWAQFIPFVASEPGILAGSGADLLRAVAPAEAFAAETGPTVPNAAALLGYTSADPALRPPRPLYLRAPDATPPQPPAWATSSRDS